MSPCENDSPPQIGLQIQCSPHRTPRDFFTEIDKVMLKFIWKFKGPITAFFDFFKKTLFIFRVRGREGNFLVASPMPPNGDLAHNPGLWPDQESNRWPFGLQVGVQSTEPCQPRADLKREEQNWSICTGWCGSVDWVQACKPKGCQFNSQAGYIPGLQARSPVRGAPEATSHWCFSPPLTPSL